MKGSIPCRLFSCLLELLLALPYDLQKLWIIPKDVVIAAEQARSVAVYCEMVAAGRGRWVGEWARHAGSVAHAKSVRAVTMVTPKDIATLMRHRKVETSQQHYIPGH